MVVKEPVVFFGWNYYNGLDCCYYPFDGLPDSAQFATPVYRNIPSYSHSIHFEQNQGWRSTGDTWRIYALGYLDGSGAPNHLRANTSSSLPTYVNSGIGHPERRFSLDEPRKVARRQEGASGERDRPIPRR